MKFRFFRTGFPSQGVLISPKVPYLLKAGFLENVIQQTRCFINKRNELSRRIEW